MKIHRDDLPGILSLNEIKAQLALGTLTVMDLIKIVELYEKSKYYLPEDVLTYLEKNLGISIRKNKYYLRPKKRSKDE